MPLAVPAMPEPSYILTYDDGGWYEGSFTDTLDEHGHGTEFYGNGNPQFQGHWKNGVREGYGMEFDEDGNPRYQGCWKNGARVGFGTEVFYNDGTEFYKMRQKDDFETYVPFRSGPA